MSQVVRRRQAQVMMLFMVVGTAQSMETQQMLQHIARLAEAANTAAQAATEATQAMTKNSKFFNARLGVSNTVILKTSRQLQW